MTTARRGPRSDIDVPTILLDTAERMFGSHKVQETSLRAVAREAGVSPAAVTHHYATKQDLLRAVIKRRASAVGLELRAGLSTLRDSTHTPAPHELVAAIVRPYVNMLNADPVGGCYWIKVFADLALSSDVLWTNEMFDHSAPLFDAVAMKALPHLRGRDFEQRLAIAMYGLLAVLSGADLAAYGKPLGPDGVDPNFVEHLIVFTSAGLAAPPLPNLG